jgi:transposase
MSKREYGRFTAEQKLELLREAEQPGGTVSEVCRRHALSPSVLYRWRAVAQSGSTVALKRDAQRKPRKDDAETRYKAEIERLRAVVTEITAENLELKKDLRLEDLSRVPAETKAKVLQIVEQTKRRSGWRVYRTLAALGVPVVCITRGSLARAWKTRLARAPISQTAVKGHDNRQGHTPVKVAPSRSRRTQMRALASWPDLRRDAHHALIGIKASSVPVEAERGKPLALRAPDTTRYPAPSGRRKYCSHGSSHRKRPSSRRVRHEGASANSTT